MAARHEVPEESLMVEANSSAGNNPGHRSRTETSPAALFGSVIGRQHCDPPSRYGRSGHAKTGRASKLPTTLPVPLGDLSGRLSEHVERSNEVGAFLRFDGTYNQPDLIAAPTGDTIDQASTAGADIQNHHAPVVSLVTAPGNQMLTLQPIALRVAVDGSTPNASARSTGRCGPREASTTRARYWGSETVSSSAKDRAATATRTRLAVRTASARSSVSLFGLLPLVVYYPACIQSL